MNFVCLSEPLLHPKIDKFCTASTTTQDDVDDALTLLRQSKMFENGWMWVMFRTALFS